MRGSSALRQIGRWITDAGKTVRCGLISIRSRSGEERITSSDPTTRSSSGRTAEVEACSGSHGQPAEGTAEEVLSKLSPSIRSGLLRGSIWTVDYLALFASLNAHPKMLCRLTAISHNVRSKRPQASRRVEGFRVESTCRCFIIFSFGSNSLDAA